MRFPALVSPVLACLLLAALPTRAAQSPAQARIERARQTAQRAVDPEARAAALVELALAETARAREVGEGAHYGRALESLARAARLDPARADLARVEAWIRLGRHEFRRAEALARTAVERHPADQEAWGLLGDALMELGRTEEAALAYQRMIALRPGPGAWLRAAYYYERVGQHEAALALLERTYGVTPAREAEHRAWLLVQMAAIDRAIGEPARAESRLRGALALFADYHYALSGLAELLIAQQRASEALPLARRALDVAPHAERWLTLADALRALGDEDAARAAEDRFEAAALVNQGEADNENLYLVDFYLDRRPDPQRALEIARREAERRPDPATLARLDRAEAMHRSAGSAR